MNRRIGIVGFGHIGEYLVERINAHPSLVLAFVWNRTKAKVAGRVAEELILSDLNDFARCRADLIVEVAAPCVTREFGPQFLKHSNFMIGSPTALADQEIEDSLRKAASQNGLYVPSGALWGGEDIKKMADSGSLKALKITMTKHPSCFKLVGPLVEKNQNLTTKRVLYDGPVRGLCPLAPNNVNTMAAAAIAAHNLGFDETQGSIVSDPSLTDWHLVEVAVTGPTMSPSGNTFTVNTLRKNPSNLAVVTGSATYGSFFSSLLGAHGKGPGVHLC